MLLSKELAQLGKAFSIANSKANKLIDLALNHKISQEEFNARYNQIRSDYFNQTGYEIDETTIGVR